MHGMALRPDLLAEPGYAFEAAEADVKLDQNEAPRDLPPEVRERALRRVSEVAWNRYPELRPRALAHAIAERDGWDPDGVVVTAGSNVAIQAWVIAAGLGRRVATVVPTFSVYLAQARVLGAEPVAVPLAPPDFRLDVPALTAALERGPGVLFLADPTAPTGHRLDDDAVHAVLDAAAAHGWMTVIDEAYAPFDGRDRLDAVRGHRDRASLRTFSKADGLGALRLGYTLTHPETAAEVAKATLPFSVSAWQAAAAEALLRDPDARAARDATIREARAERERLLAALAAHPDVDPLPSVTNFVTFRVPVAGATFEALMARGVRVRRQDHLPGLDGALRVSVGTPRENDAFLAALDAAIPSEAHRG